jgi:uncharacterized membrane protein YfcA
MGEPAKEEPEPFWPLITVAAAVAIATFVMSMSLEWWGNTVYRSVLITALVLMVLADIQMIRDYYRKKRAGVPKSDERLDRIVIYASAYSWRVAIPFMIALVILNLLKVSMDPVVALSASVLVMAGAFFVFYWHFNRKGDVH